MQCFTDQHWEMITSGHPPLAKPKTDGRKSRYQSIAATQPERFGVRTGWQE